MLNYIPLLKKVDLFKGLTFTDLDYLFTKDLYEIKNYKKNFMIYLQNEKCTTFDIILKGTIVVQGIDSKGNVLTISDFTIGDVIGGNLLFSHKNFYPMTIIAKTDAIILHIKKDLTLKLCQVDINFLNNFLQSISDKTLILTDKIKALSMKTIRQCIIDFLIYESYSQSSKTVKLEFTKKELAEKFGIQRPSLSRELNKMRRDGLIEYNAHSITIIDMESLTYSD
ncbi:Crp/Fnr family transcriptional regulator [Clostridium algoriphilum]|uniref:Crp/Fnr family transcriptional regulator n=1 Tax=Clostridium algoriphilum TaxID=198347 RepID=UPI001CF1D198|nr:Crp/Fnr family transcriptional regulator [Clostridium algoriphilum]MCB2293578.1 Crp/Fnr family transcriptional regulator [Clostridium algoriphilum]